MSDVLDRIRADAAKADAARERNRREFPGVAAIVDELSAEFGEVRVLHAVESGKSIGKPQAFDGVDVDRIIAADDWHNAAQARRR